ILLNLNADVNGKGEDGVTPLSAAVIAQRADIVEILLEKGADVNCFDGRGISPLMAAVETGNTRLAQILLENGANVNLTNECDITSLYAAAFKRDVAMIELLLERGADSNILTTGENIFRNAERTENLEVVVWLLKNRPTTSNDHTESHSAASIIEEITKNWAGVNLEDELRTLEPGSCNWEGPHVETDSEFKLSSAIRCLINEPGDGNAVDIFIYNVTNRKIINLIRRIHSIRNYYRSVNSFKILWRYHENRLQLFRIVVELNDSKISRYIFRYISLNELSEISGDLLCMAVHKEYSSLIDVLLERGYAVNKPDPDGFTPVMIAVAKRDSVVWDLLRYNADVNFKANDTGLTALYIAALIGDRYMINKLLEYGANKNINTSEDVFESCKKLLQRYKVDLRAVDIFESRNELKDIIEEEAKGIGTTKDSDDTADNNDTDDTTDNASS
ncbi:hypothetical protein Trydic_g20229, partial [Trypoxylus dichotomus]